MSTTPHPRVQLSAYLDGALSPAERTAVAAHLASCPECEARLSELREVARLMAALPAAAPSRRLVPRIAAVPAWLAPLRTLSTIASGVSVFLFIASALLANIGTLASTTASQIPALAPFGGAAAAPAPSNASRNAAGATAAAAPPAAQDATKLAASASPSSAPNFEVAQPTTVASADEHTASQPIARSQPNLGTPWIWLVLAVLTGAVAIVLQRRLRSA